MLSDIRIQRIVNRCNLLKDEHLYFTSQCCIHEPSEIKKLAEESLKYRKLLNLMKEEGVTPEIISSIMKKLGSESQ